MRGALVVITGTGTDVGKTHFSVALLYNAAAKVSVCGVKPIESGAEGPEGDDARRLREASSFHVTHPTSTYVFRRPVSPHLAARDEHVNIDAATICRATLALRETTNVLLELPGGLFSPLGPGLLNIDLALALEPTAVLLVTLDRLGVLHDVAATARAAEGRIALTGLVLNTPAQSDASTGTNAAEMILVTQVPVLAQLARAEAGHLAGDPQLDALVRRCFPLPA